MTQPSLHSALHREPCPACGCPGEKYDGHVCEDYLREALGRAASVAEHLMQMIDPRTWRDTGADDGQGHYEGDYRAEQIAAEIAQWKETASV